MSKRKYDDFGDDFDDGTFLEDDTFLDDEDLAFGRIQKRHDPRGPARPKRRDDGSGGHGDEPDHRRELASLNAWGAPY